MMKGQKYMGPTVRGLEVQGVAVRKPRHSAKERNAAKRAAALHGLQALSRLRQRMSANKAAKGERLARITAQRWEAMKPLVEHFAAAPSTEAAKDLLRVDAEYTGALAAETKAKS